MIYSILKALEWSQHFSHYNYMGIFLRHPRAATLTVQGLIWPNFEPIQAFMVDLVTCKNERMKKTQSKIKALEWSQHYSSIFKMLKGS